MVLIVMLILWVGQVNDKLESVCNNNKKIMLRFGIK